MFWTWQTWPIFMIDTRGATRMARGGITWTHKKHPNQGVKIDLKYTFLHAFFLICPSCPFPKFVYMTKNTPFFSNFARFCTPKRCTRVQCLVLRNNPNYVNFLDEPDTPLDIRVAPPDKYHISCNKYHFYNKILYVPGAKLHKVYIRSLWLGQKNK